jgi:hypothetical protein
VITSANNTTFTAGSAATFSVTTTGYPAAALSETGALPSGITFIDNGNGTATLAGNTAVSGSFPITITANNGTINAVQSFTLTVNPLLYQLLITASPAAGGTVTPASGLSYSPGTVVPISATAATGYTFFGWTSAADPIADSTASSTTITINGPESVTAQFVPNLVVTTNQDDPGTATNCTPQVGTVTGTDASCSLRDALLNAASAGAANIGFDSTAFATPQTITLSNGTLTIPSNAFITGPTTGSVASLTNLVTVSGAGSSNPFSVFTVNSGVTGSSLNSLIIINGSNQYGGGISNSGGLAVIGSTISGNSASAGGAGIYNNGGALTLYGSTLSGNSVTNALSSGASGGGILNTGSISVLNSTFTANTAISASVGTGGAISSSGGTVILASSTISGN